MICPGKIDIGDPMSLSNILFVEGEKQSHMIASANTSNMIGFLDDLSDADRSTDKLLSNEMINYDTTFAVDGISPSSSMENNSDDVLEQD